MEIPMPVPIVAIRDVLYQLGFAEEWGTMTDRQPAFAYKVGKLDVSAAEVMSLYLRPEILFGGTWSTPRSFKLIEFSMPLAVESADQALAWIVFGIGLDFDPTVPVEWFERGKRLQHLLPWEVARRRLREEAEEYDRLRMARPHCLVAREWMRVVNKQLRSAAKNAIEGDTFLVEFDGRMLRIELPGTVIGVPASGPMPWPAAYRGRLVCIANDPPRRLLSDPVEVGIWEGRLEIGRTVLDVVLVDGRFNA